jgi:hypothetical protein
VRVAEDSIGENGERHPCRRQFRDDVKRISEQFAGSGHRPANETGQPDVRSPGSQGWLSRDLRVTDEPCPQLGSCGSHLLAFGGPIPDRSDQLRDDLASTVADGLGEHVVEQTQRQDQVFAWQAGPTEQVREGGLLLQVEWPDPDPGNWPPRRQPGMDRLP